MKSIPVMFLLCPKCDKHFTIMDCRCCEHYAGENAHAVICAYVDISG